MTTETYPTEEIPPYPSTYAARLAYAMSRLGLPKHRRRPVVSEAVGLSHAGLSQVLNDKTGKRALSAEHHMRVARHCKVDAFWLATGEGDPEPKGPSAEAMDAARFYDTLNDDQRKQFWRILSVVHPAGEEETQPPPPPPPGPVGARPSLSKARA